MAYGAEVLGPSGSTVLNSTIAMEGTIAITYGVGSSISYERDEILVVRKVVPDTETFLLCAYTTVSGTTLTTNFTNEFGSSTTANYAVLKTTKNVTPTGTYGLVTYASDGITRVFDSRLFAGIGSFNITNVAAGGSYPNGSTLNTYNTYEYYNGRMLIWFSANNFYGIRSLRFSNNHSTHGTSVKYVCQKTIFGFTTNPDLETGTFWGNFV